MNFYECINFCNTFTPQFLLLQYSNCKKAKSKIPQKFQISFSKILPNKSSSGFCPKNQKLEAPYQNPLIYFSREIKKY